MSKGGKVCFVSVDVEHDVGTIADKRFQGVEEMDKLFWSFEKFGVPLTLFVTGDVLSRYSIEARKWAEKYEIASHSYCHRFFNELNTEEREADIRQFLQLYQSIFSAKPLGFRAPSHVIDAGGIKILERCGFMYDSSVVPHYPPLKKYRGYSGRAPLRPYKIGGLVEIPAAGQLMGIPLAGAWIRKLPVLFYQMLFWIHKPKFITLSMHSWDILDKRSAPKLLKILEIVKNSGYVFKSGEQIAMERVSG